MRHLRLTQLLRYEGFTGKDLKFEREKEHKEWREDGESLPTIEQTRKMHTTLGTWDKLTKWEIISFGDTMINNINILYPYKDHFRVKSVRPRANYKAIKKAKEARWKEQERITEEFFDSMGV